MIHAIIFSKNRALQLRLLLESMEKYAKGVFDITVLYNPIGEEFEKGYEKLMQEYSQIEWIRRGNLKNQVITELNKPYEYTAYFCDDDVFYQPITEDLRKVFTNDVIAFSLHLGTNHEYCYTENKPVSIKNYLPLYLADGGEYILWNYKDEKLDFAYPFTITSHIYKTEDILKITQGIEFNSPNTYEIAMQSKDIGKHIMASYFTSRVVNNPINMVQDQIPNRHGNTTAEELNRRYLNGEVIDINCLPTKVTATHQEFPYTFIKYVV